MFSVCMGGVDVSLVCMGGVDVSLVCMGGGLKLFGV